tara:strand:- start:2639 stop:2803 length:165 start_codon:yes stop_codon:yes gene_type:complete
MNFSADFSLLKELTKRINWLFYSFLDLTKNINLYLSLYLSANLIDVKTKIWLFF